MRTSAGEYAMHVCKIVLLGQVLSGVAVATLPMMTRSAAIDGDDKQYYIMAAARLLLLMMMMILDETFRG